MMKLRRRQRNGPERAEHLSVVDLSRSGIHCLASRTLSVGAAQICCRLRFSASVRFRVACFPGFRQCFCHHGPDVAVTCLRNGRWPDFPDRKANRAEAARQQIWTAPTFSRSARSRKRKLRRTFIRILTPSAGVSAALENRISAQVRRIRWTCETSRMSPKKGIDKSD